MKVDTHRIEAVVRKDAAVLERLYGDDYVSTDSEGGAWTKSQEIANVSSGVLSLASYKLEDMNALAWRPNKGMQPTARRPRRG